MSEINEVIDQIQNNFFDYEVLEKIFNELLQKKLRKHEISRVLELWVPDSNIEAGILSLIDSIKSSNIESFQIQLPNSYLENNLIQNIELKAGYIKKYEIIETKNSHSIISFKLISDYKKKIENNSQILSAELPKHPKNKFEIPEIDFSFKLKKISKKNISDFLDFDLKFKKSLEERLNNIKYENNQSSDFNYISEVDGATLSVLIDNQGIIKNCQHVNFKNNFQKALIDIFISNILETPIQEAYEHGVVFTIDSIIKENFIDHAKGITLPKNAGSLFLLPNYLMHQIFQNFVSQKNKDITINFHYRPASLKWKKMAYEEKTELVVKIIHATLQSSNYKQNDLILHNIAKNRNGDYTRCTVIFNDDIPYSLKPSLLRKLELNLKRHIDNKLEVFATAAKDTSPLRRLS